MNWEAWQQLAVSWRDEVANVRLHQTTRQRPIDRFSQESPLLRSLPVLEFDTDEVVPTIVTSHAKVHFDGNRYSVPPSLVQAPVMIRGSSPEIVGKRGRLKAPLGLSKRGCSPLIASPSHRLRCEGDATARRTGRGPFHGTASLWRPLIQKTAFRGSVMMLM